LEPAGRL